jgi:hypothetical protein
LQTTTLRDATPDPELIQAGNDFAQYLIAVSDRMQKLHIKLVSEILFGWAKGRQNLCGRRFVDARPPWLPTIFIQSAFNTFSEGDASTSLADVYIMPSGFTSSPAVMAAPVAPERPLPTHICLPARIPKGGQN